MHKRKHRHKRICTHTFAKHVRTERLNALGLLYFWQCLYKTWEFQLTKAPSSSPPPPLPQLSVLSQPIQLHQCREWMKQTKSRLTLCSRACYETQNRNNPIPEIESFYPCPPTQAQNLMQENSCARQRGWFMTARENLFKMYCRNL